MNLILIDQHEINEQSVSLSGRRAKHVRKVLRSQCGDTVRIGIINGPTGSGLIREIEHDRILLDITAATPPPPKSPTGLILALPRPIMLKRVLAQAASMGVAKIFLINAGRVEKSFFKASIMTEENLRQRLILGLEQAMDTVLPEISVHTRFRPFVEDLLPVISRDCQARMIAHPGNSKNMNQTILSTPAAPALIAIGPEGGWSNFEVELFKGQGFQNFTLGSRILRVDTAVPAILAQLDLLRGQANDQSSS